MYSSTWITGWCRHLPACPWASWQYGAALALFTCVRLLTALHLREKTGELKFARDSMLSWLQADSVL